MNTKTETRPEIPHGDYCYERTGRMKTVEHVIDENGQLKKVNPYQVPELRLCPHWSLPAKWNGYCAFLKQSDKDLKCGLLWDQVKECGENEDKIPE